MTNQVVCLGYAVRIQLLVGGRQIKVNATVRGSVDEKVERIVKACR